MVDNQTVKTGAIKPQTKQTKNKQAKPKLTDKAINPAAAEMTHNAMPVPGKYDELNQTQAVVERMNGQDDLLDNNENSPVKADISGRMENEAPMTQQEPKRQVADLGNVSRMETNLGIGENVPPNMLDSPLFDIDEQSQLVMDKIREQWSRLDEQDIDLYAESRDQFLARLVDVYGIAHDEAEDQLQEIEIACDEEDEEQDRDRAS